MYPQATRKSNLIQMQNRGNTKSLKWRVPSNPKVKQFGFLSGVPIGSAGRTRLALIATKLLTLIKETGKFT